MLDMKCALEKFENSETKNRKMTRSQMERDLVLRPMVPLGGSSNGLRSALIKSISVPTRSRSALKGLVSLPE